MTRSKHSGGLLTGEHPGRWYRLLDLLSVGLGKLWVAVFSAELVISAAYWFYGSHGLPPRAPWVPKVRDGLQWGFIGLAAVFFAIAAAHGTENKPSVRLTVANYLHAWSTFLWCYPEVSPHLLGSLAVFIACMGYFVWTRSPYTAALVVSHGYLAVFVSLRLFS